MLTLFLLALASCKTRRYHGTSSHGTSSHSHGSHYIYSRPTITEQDPNGLKKFIKKAVKTLVVTPTKAAVKVTTEVAKATGQVTVGATKLVVQPQKAGEIIKSTASAVGKDIKAIVKAIKPVVKDVKKITKKVFKVIKVIAPYVGIVMCWVPGIGQIALAASIASLVSTAYKAYQLYELGNAIYQGIKTKDFAGALMSAASVVAGAAGGTAAAKVADYAVKAQKLYTEGAQIYKGIKTGDYKEILSGAAGIVGKDLPASIVAKSELLQQGLEYYSKGSQYYQQGKTVYKAVKDGKFDTAVLAAADLGVQVTGGSQTATQIQATAQKIIGYSEQAEVLITAAKDGTLAQQAVKLGVKLIGNETPQQIQALINKVETTQQVIIGFAKDGMAIYQSATTDVAAAAQQLEAKYLGDLQKTATLIAGTKGAALAGQATDFFMALEDAYETGKDVAKTAKTITDGITKDVQVGDVIGTIDELQALLSRAKNSAPRVHRSSHHGHRHHVTEEAQG